jgi:hypothetical protein
MSYLDDQEPPGWRELCDQLKTETDRDKFKALLAQINDLLRTHEKANRRENTPNPPPRPGC